MNHHLPGQALWFGKNSKNGELGQYCIELFGSPRHTDNVQQQKGAP